MPVPHTPTTPSNTDYRFTFDEIREQLANLGITDLTDEQLFSLKKHLDGLIAKDLKEHSLESNMTNISLNSDGASSDDSQAATQITPSLPNRESSQTDERSARRWNDRALLLPASSTIPNISNSNENVPLERRVSSPRSRSKTNHHSFSSYLAHLKQPDVRTDSDTISSLSDIESPATPQPQAQMRRRKDKSSSGGLKIRRSSKLQFHGDGERIDSEENTSKGSKKLPPTESQSHPSRTVPAPWNSQPQANVTRTSMNASLQRPPSRVVRTPLLVHRPTEGTHHGRQRYVEESKHVQRPKSKSSKSVSVKDVSQDSDRSSATFSDRLRPNSAVARSASRCISVRRLIEPSQKSKTRRSSSALCEHRPPSTSDNLSLHNFCSEHQLHLHSDVHSTSSIVQDCSPNFDPRLPKTLRKSNLKRSTSACSRSRQLRSAPNSRFARFSEDPVQNVYGSGSREHGAPGTSEANQLSSFKPLDRPSSMNSQSRLRHRRLDPVSRYHSYRRSWLTYRAPGEDARRVLRWNIKTAMMHREVPLLQRNFAEVAELFGGSAVDYLRRERQQNLKALNPSYIPPTSKRHDAERWRVRSALNNIGAARIH